MGTTLNESFPLESSVDAVLARLTDRTFVDDRTAANASLWQITENGSTDAGAGAGAMPHATVCKASAMAAIAPRNCLMAACMFSWPLLLPA